MAEKKHPISYAATKKELEMLDRVKSYHKRTTNSDTIRFLINQENEKILHKNISKEIIK